MEAEEGVEVAHEGEGVSWLEVEDRAEVQGLAGGNQLEEGGVVRALLSTLLSGSRSRKMATSGYWMWPVGDVASFNTPLLGRSRSAQ